MQAPAIEQSNKANLEAAKPPIEENTLKQTTSTSNSAGQNTAIINTAQQETETSNKELNKELHQHADQDKPKKDLKSENSSAKKKSGTNLAGLANFASIGLNLVSAITHGVKFFSKKNSKLAKLTEKASLGGSLGTKAFYLVNSIQNVINRFNVSDYLGMLGYAFDIPISLFAKQSNIFLWRGFSTGAYTFANGAKEAIQKEKFDGFFDFARGMGQAISKAFSYLEGGVDGFWNNLVASKTGLQSMIAGVFLFIAPIFWRVTGLKFIATCIRDFGGITQDLAQIKLGYILKGDESNESLPRKLLKALKRSLGLEKPPENSWPLYFRSGIGVTFGTIFDWVRGVLEKFKGDKDLAAIATALTYITDGTGIYLLGRSQDEEIGTNGKEPHNEPVQDKEEELAVEAASTEV